MHTFSRKQVVEDFDYLIKTLEDVHPDLFASVNENEAREQICEARRTLQDEMSIEAFYRKVGTIVSSFKDGHTFISLYQSMQSDSFLFFPISLSFKKLQAYISFDITDTFHIGDEVLCINDVETAKIISEMLPYSSAETEVFRYALMKRSFYIHLSVLFNIHSPFRLKIKRKDTILEKTIKGLSSAELEELSKRKNLKSKSLKESFDIEDNIGILTIPTFGYHKEKSDEFKKFIDDAFDQLISRNISNLIIDVRDNGGGNSELAKYIASYLTSKPVYSFSRILWKSSQQVRNFVLDDIQNDTYGYYEQKDYDHLSSVKTGECYHWDYKSNPDSCKHKHIYRGETLVLSNTLCFSSTTDFLAMIRDFGLGKIVGSATGGLPNSFGDCYYFHLPNTKLFVSVSQKLFVRPSGNENDNDLTPDYVVYQTDEDRGNQVDTVMAFAKQLCLNNRSNPDAHTAQ